MVFERRTSALRIAPVTRRQIPALITISPTSRPQRAPRSSRRKFLPSTANQPAALPWAK
jgi:hypothetical protein